jgi:serine/threonine-protein kinase
MYNEEGKVIAGKDDYLSPEQASYQVTDHRADVFALAIVLTELLLLRNIFRGTSRAETLGNILELQVPPMGRLRPEIDADLDAILQQALTRDRDKRTSSAGTLLQALEIYLYSDGYGPTNEKLAVYLKEIFDSENAPRPPRRAPPAPPNPPAFRGS